MGRLGQPGPWTERASRPDLWGDAFWEAHEAAKLGRAADCVCALEGILAEEPGHAAALVLLGDTLNVDYEDLGLNPRSARRRAAHLFVRAIRADPSNPEAWAGLALSCVFLGHHWFGLWAAEVGMEVVGTWLDNRLMPQGLKVWITEALLDVRIRALWGLGRRDEARDALREALDRVPASEFLSWLVPRVDDPAYVGRDLRA